jgi:hypothetical protein
MLFWIIFAIFIIYYIRKKNSQNTNRQNTDRPGDGNTLYEKRRVTTQLTQNQTAEKSYRSEPRRMNDADRERLAQYRARKDAAKKTSYTYTAPAAASAKTASYTAPAAAAKQQKSTDILSRAQQNVKKYEADVTLEELEQDHDHTEQSARTISKEELQQRKDMHPHDAAHVSAEIASESESILGTLEDLMVKGYDGRLSFERDFVGEGMDMISRFTVPDTIPDGSGTAL